jgi:hypothetical protein
MSDAILHRQSLDNGLELIFTDLSNRYYGNFYQIKIDVLSTIRLTDSFLHASDLSEKEQVRAKNRFGDTLETHQELKRMGVAGSDVAKVTKEMVQQFLDTSLPYMSIADFPARLLRQRLFERPVLKKIYG